MLEIRNPKTVFLSMYTPIARLKGLADLYREDRITGGRLTPSESIGVSVLLNQIADEIKTLANQLVG